MIKEYFAQFKLKIIQYKNKITHNYLTEKGMRYYKYLSNIIIDDKYEPQNYEEILFEETFSTAIIKYKGEEVTDRKTKAIIAACYLAPLYPPEYFWNDPNVVKCIGI